MNAANIYPCGILGVCVSIFSWGLIAGVKAGVHSNTKVYMAPSNKDCISPKNKILLSENKISHIFILIISNKISPYTHIKLYI